MSRVILYEGETARPEQSLAAAAAAVEAAVAVVAGAVAVGAR